MSWRPSGGSKPQSPPPSAPKFSSGKGGPPVLDPSLQGLIIAALVAGLVGLGLAVAFGGALGAGGSQTAAQPAATEVAARPTAPPVATTAPAADATAPAGAATAPAAAATTAPAGAAGIPTEPHGPALATGSGQAVTLGSDGELLAFDQTEVSVPNGLVTLTFNNNSSAVQHNFVLVNGDDTLASTVNDAAQAQVKVTRNAAGSVPPADTAGLLVATQMIDPAGNVTFTFETPAAGTYQFFCTFPGHYLAGMKGQLVVN